MGEALHLIRRKVERMQPPARCAYLIVAMKCETPGSGRYGELQRLLTRARTEQIQDEIEAGKKKRRKR